MIMHNLIYFITEHTEESIKEALRKRFDNIENFKIEKFPTGHRLIAPIGVCLGVKELQDMLEVGSVNWCDCVRQ